MYKPLRIATHISHKGYSSRKEAERLVINGKVNVNGKIVTNLSTKIKYDDILRIDGLIVKNYIKYKLFLFNKPRSVITTHSDPKGRIKVYDFFPKKLKSQKIGKLHAVGRLDFNSQGLILITNNVKLKTFLENPNTWVEIILSEGKNREIRKLFLKYGYSISKLVRTAYGPYKLGNIAIGEFRETAINKSLLSKHVN